MVGYAGSIPEGPGRDISVAQQAEYLAAWLEARDLGPVLVVGHDLGGGVAQILAVRHPALVRGLVLMNAICYDSWPIPSVRLMQATSGLVASLPRPALRLLLASLFLRGHDDRACARESFAEHWPAYAAPGGAAALAHQVRALHTQDTLVIAEALKDLELPARLVWGAADQFQKVGYGERLARDLRAPLDRIEGGKHFVPEDHADRVAAAINSVL
jgi:pimeloyl-ACP methyl ester carboxylesterase